MSGPVSAKFRIKRHARRPYLMLSIKDADGVAFDLTGASFAKFQMKDDEGNMKITDGSGTIVSPPTSGILKYQWQTGDTDTEGNFYAEFDIEYSAGDDLTVPVDGDILIMIKEDVNNA